MSRFVDYQHRTNLFVIHNVNLVTFDVPERIIHWLNWFKYRRIEVPDIHIVVCKLKRKILDVDENEYLINRCIGQLKIGGFEHGYVRVCYNKWFDLFYPIHTLIRDLLWYYFIYHRGLTFLHGACLYKDSNCILITGFDDIGKSTIAYKLMIENGFQVLSDDLTLISSEGRALAFPTPIKLHYDVVAEHEPSIKNKLLGYVDKLVKKIPFIRRRVEIVKYILVNTWVKGSNVDIVIFLEHSNELKWEKINKDYLIERLQNLNLYERAFWDSRLFIKYFTKTGISMTKILQREHEIIKNFLENVEEVYRVTYTVRPYAHVRLFLSKGLKII